MEKGTIYCEPNVNHKKEVLIYTAIHFGKVGTLKSSYNQYKHDYSRPYYYTLKDFYQKT